MYPLTKQIILSCILFMIIYIRSIEAQQPPSSDDDGDNEYGFSEDQRILFSLCPELLNAPIEVAKESRYHNVSGSCFRLYTDGPCGKTMSFGYQNNIYGECYCSSSFDEYLPLPLVLHSPTNQCYHIYTKGYCNESEWIAPDPSTKEPKCVHNPCEAKTAQRQAALRDEPAESISPLVPFEGGCVELGARLLQCSSVFRGKIAVSGSSDHFEVKCEGFSPPLLAVIVKKPSPCPPGTYLTITRKCQTGWKWD